MEKAKLVCGVSRTFVFRLFLDLLERVQPLAHAVDVQVLEAEVLALLEVQVVEDALQQLPPETRALQQQGRKDQCQVCQHSRVDRRCQSMSGPPWPRAQKRLSADLYGITKLCPHDRRSVRQDGIPGEAAVDAVVGDVHRLHSIVYQHILGLKLILEYPSVS